MGHDAEGPVLSHPSRLDLIIDTSGGFRFFPSLELITCSALQPNLGAFEKANILAVPIEYLPLPMDPKSASLNENPKIMPITNGPLYLINSQVPEKIENLKNSRGEPISKIISVALCRCGGSKNKPFCDGTHSSLGFSSENENPPQTIDKRKDYIGKKITVHDNRRICSHSAECIRNLETVFKLGEKPWINPDGASYESVIETVKKCPSGALSYSVDGIEHRDQTGRKPVVIVEKNGPYRVEGGIELIGISSGAEGASREHYTLCRCGASNNKPFCDGTHLQIRFKDDKN